MELIFQLPDGAPHDTVLACFEALGAVMLGRAVALRPHAHHALRDTHTGGEGCFNGTWLSEGAHYEASVVPGPGDPRDGLSYDVRFWLTVEGPSGPATARMQRASWGTRIPTMLFVTVEGTPLTLYPALRAAVTASVPNVADRCASSTVVCTTLRQFVDGGHTDLALALAREALASAPKGTAGHSELVEYVERLAPSAGGLARRLQDAPARLEGWLEAATAPPSGVSQADVAATLARLVPYDSQRWADAGLTSPPWTAHPSWPVRPARVEQDVREWWTLPLPATRYAVETGNAFLKALTGAPPDDDAESEGPFEGDGGWVWYARRRARWAEGEALPRARVTLVAKRPDSKSASQEEVVWEWVSGPAAGDAVVWVQRETGSGDARAFAWVAVGSESFASRVRGAWEHASPYRWEAVPPATSLIPRTTPEFPWLRPLCTRDSREGAIEALALGGVPDAVRSQAVALLSCRCPRPVRGLCEHGAALAALRRAELATATDAAEQVRANARDAALSVVRSAMGEAPHRSEWIQAIYGLNAALAAVAALREDGS